MEPLKNATHRRRTRCADLKRGYVCVGSAFVGYSCLLRKKGIAETGIERPWRVLTASLQVRCQQIRLPCSPTHLARGRPRRAGGPLSLEWEKAGERTNPSSADRITVAQTGDAACDRHHESRASSLPGIAYPEEKASPVPRPGVAQNPPDLFGRDRQPLGDA